jgi:hypothetical protein
LSKKEKMRLHPLACLALALLALVVVWSAEPAAAEPIGSDEGSAPLDENGMPMQTKPGERIVRRRLSVTQLTTKNLEETLRRYLDSSSSTTTSVP